MDQGFLRSHRDNISSAPALIRRAKHRQGCHPWHGSRSELASTWLAGRSGDQSRSLFAQRAVREQPRRGMRARTCTPAGRGRLGRNMSVTAEPHEALDRGGWRFGMAGQALPRHHTLNDRRGKPDQPARNISCGRCAAGPARGHRTFCPILSGRDRPSHRRARVARNSRTQNSRTQRSGPSGAGKTGLQPWHRTACG